MAAPVIPLLLLAGVAWAASNDEKKTPPLAGVPAGPPGSPEAFFDKAALEALTELRAVAGGAMPVRYFRAPVAAQLLAMLGAYTAHPLGQVNGANGPESFFQLVPGAPPAGVLNARDTAIVARGLSGAAVLCTLGAVVPSGQMDRRMAVVPLADRSLLATVGQPWAVLLDDTTAMPGAQPAQQQGSPVPQQGQPQQGAQPPPSVAQILANVPGGAAILQQLGGLGQTPGAPGIFGQPGTPPGQGVPIPVPGQPLPGVPQVPGGVPLDAHMSPAAQAVIRGMLADPQLEPSACDEAAKDADASGFPMAAAALRARANELRFAQQLQGMKAGGVPFVIRKDDTPVFLAKYYGGLSKDLLESNPDIHTETRPSATNPEKSITYFKPWEIGQTILLPNKWKPASKPPPPRAPSGSIPLKSQPKPAEPKPIEVPEQIIKGDRPPEPVITPGPPLANRGTITPPVGV